MIPDGSHKYEFDENYFKLPQPIINKGGCNLSFAGLKTAVLRESKNINGDQQLKYNLYFNEYA